MIDLNSTSIVAEIGSIHDGSLGNALKAIDTVKNCGADFVKFQTHIADAESLPNAPNPSFFTDEDRNAYFKRTSFCLDEWKIIANECKKKGISFLSSPFSIEAVDILEKVGTNYYKIPSGEVTNLPLLEYISTLNKTVFLSSGMSSWEELSRAVKILRKGGPLIIMQCSSIYPCPPEKVGLNEMIRMKETFNCPVGFSDHTLGHSASISAVALGSVLIEKHFTFSKLMYGSDAKHSMEPKEFAEFCKNIKEATLIRNNPIDKDNISEFKQIKKIFEKSVVSVRELNMGEYIKEGDLTCKKPGDGISSSNFYDLIGRKVIKSISKNQKISWSDIEKL